MINIKESENMKFNLVYHKNVKPNSPIVIEGLPGIGNVARIVVDYLIDSLKLEKFATIYSDTFPNAVFLDDKSVVELPNMELYLLKQKKNDIVFLVGDVQPVKESDSYYMSGRLLDLFDEMKISQLITLGGIGLAYMPKKINVHGAATNEKLVKVLAKSGIICDGKKTVGMIIGAAGLLMGLSKVRNTPAISLLAETLGHPNYMGFRSAKEIIIKLTSYIGLNVSLDGLNKEIKKMDGYTEAHVKHHQHDDMQSNAEYLEMLKSPEMGYIG